MKVYSWGQRDRYCYFAEACPDSKLAGTFNEVKAFRSACGDAHLKTILATGELGSLRMSRVHQWFV